MQQGGAGGGGGGGGGGGVTRQEAVQNLTNYNWAESSHFSTPVKQMEGKRSSGRRTAFYTFYTLCQDIIFQNHSLDLYQLYSINNHRL